MTIIYRTDGAWGTGKGVNLVPAEVDGNFYDLDGRVSYLVDNPPEAITPVAINIEGGLFTMTMSDGSTLGPIVMTYPMPTWRGNWAPATPYNELDFFIAPDGGLGAVMLSHTSAATFDWGALDTGSGLPVYRQLIGGSGTTSGIADLVDVALSTQADHDMLVWDAAPSLWRNQTPAVVVANLPAFGGSTGSATGLKGVVPAPAAGDAAAGKVLGAGGAWVVPAGGSGGSSSLAGLSDVAIVSPVNLSLLQYSSVDGKWHNQTLATLGAGTVTHIDTAAGLAGGPITGTGTISLAAIPTLDLLANVTGASAAPAGVSLSTLLDAVLGTARGSVMWRSATGWVALTAGTAGQFLRTGGTGADVTWGTPAGAGTVTQVNSGTGLTGGPITATGTLSLATVSDSQVLANISGSVAAPTGTTLTLLLDHALGATQGMILYRGAASWSALAPGTSGAVLTSGGAAANPSWVTGSGAGTVTSVATGTGLIGGPITGTGTISFATVGNQTLLANISGSTAAPTSNTMSAIMDAVFSATRGSMLYRGASGWSALTPGTSGQVLTTGGAGADPSWAAGGAGAAKITIGDTPPSTPAGGDGWWDSNAGGGQLYLWFNDGSSSQWVPASNQPGPQGPPGTSIPLPVAVASGGTGSTTAAAALTALGAVAKAGDTMTGKLIVTPSVGGIGLSVTSSSAFGGQITAENYAADATGPYLIMRKGRPAAGATQNGDALGTVQFTGVGSGGGSADAGYITSIATGAASASFVPNALAFFTSSGTTEAERMRIDSAGNVGIGKTPTVALDVVGGINATSIISSQNGYQARAGAPGPGRASVFNIDWVPGAQLWIDSSNLGTIAFTSDYRAKENVVDLPSVWGQVKALRPVSFNWCANPEMLRDEADPVERWGFIAHELQETLLPTAASGYKDAPNFIQSPDLLALLATVTRALQEAMARIEALEGKPASRTR